MKNWLCLILMLLAVLGFAGCGDGNSFEFEPLPTEAAIQEGFEYIRINIGSPSLRVTYSDDSEEYFYYNQVESDGITLSVFPMVDDDNEIIVPLETICEAVGLAPGDFSEGAFEYEGRVFVKLDVVALAIDGEILYKDSDGNFTADSSAWDEVTVRLTHK
jgi:hypothetical protein